MASPVLPKIYFDCFRKQSYRQTLLSRFQNSPYVTFFIHLVHLPINIEILLTIVIIWQNTYIQIMKNAMPSNTNCNTLILPNPIPFGSILVLQCDWLLFQNKYHCSVAMWLHHALYVTPKI